MPLAPSVCIGRWIRATWLGWLLGIPLVVIFALIGEALGIGGSQGLVGLGMGAGVGLMQRRVLVPVIERSWSWFVATAIGLGIPFVGYDLLRVLKLDIEFSLYLSVALGGAIVGIWQGLILRRHGGSMPAWVLASVVGWSAAAALTGVLEVGQGPSGISGAFLFLGVVALGGLVLGAATGWAMIRTPLHRPG